jgi:MFS family permease
MIFSLLPLFVTEVLGASKTTLGLIEGAAIFAAFAFKVFAGVLSDYWRNRKRLIVWGTWLGLCAKPLFVLATGSMWVMAARALDRVSKGVRSSPTDALIADLAQDSQRASSYGLRQMLYVLGAVVGVGVAALVMWLSGDQYRLVFALALLPNALALVLLYRYVPEPATLGHSGPQWHWRDLGQLPPAFWQFLAVVFVLMLARFSEAFLVLKAKDIGWASRYVPLLLIPMDLVHALVAYPFGRLGDRYKRQRLLFQSLWVFLAADVVFVTQHNVPGLVLGFLLMGLHMGMSQGLLSTLVAQVTPGHLRGTAFAVYYLTCGTAVLLGNTLAGQLADRLGIVAPFVGGTLWVLLSLLLLSVMMRKAKG